MIEKSIISPKEASDLIKAGDAVMISGFLGCGTADTIVKAIAENCPHKDLSLIANDTAFDKDGEPKNGVSPLIYKKIFKKFFGCHIGTNKETQRQNNEGEIEINLMPMGTFIDRMRAAGSGLGGILTPTGLGTEVAEGKKILEVDGKEYLLETPLKANVAILKAKKADKGGNLIYDKTAKNFNTVMATAADIVIVEAEEIVEMGEIDPEAVETPFIFVDYIVQGEK